VRAYPVGAHGITALGIDLALALSHKLRGVLR
jgi:hypothetical protein